jgi:hypothetical protein
VCLVSAVIKIQVPYYVGNLYSIGGTNSFSGRFPLQGSVWTDTRIGQIPNIQGDKGGICNTLGNDSMCDSKLNSSYKHRPILDGYGVMTV